MAISPIRFPPRDVDHRAPWPRSRRDWPAVRRGPRRWHPSAAGCREVLLRTTASAPMPSMFVKAVTGSSARSLARFESTARASGCSDSFSTDPATISSSSAEVPGGGDQIHHLRLAERQRAGLVEDHHVELVASSKRRGVLEQDAVHGPGPVPTIGGIGVARPSASGAGDHEHRDRQGGRHSRVGRAPRTRRRRSSTPIDGNHDQPLRCLGRPAAVPAPLVLRLLHQLLTICASAVSAPTLVAR